MTILPGGQLPSAAVFGAVAALVMLIGVVLNAVSLLGAIVVWVGLTAYLVFAARQARTAKR